MLNATVSDGRLLRLNRPFKVGSKLDCFKGDLHDAPAQTEAFEKFVSMWIVNDLLKGLANSELDEFPMLDQVQGCMVVTGETEFRSVPMSRALGSTYAGRVLASGDSVVFLSQVGKAN
ncbi:MAG: hypothetical protein JSS56_23485 [Proteobacteria bacterium]|nr:hypothetical protein [Pseudomonadota bacterium]